MTDSAKILIVDDDEITSAALAEILRTSGYDVTGIARSGQEGVEMVKENTPDLVIMDIVLPGGMDGIEAATVVQRDFDIPVLYITAYDEEELFTRAKITLPFAYILKPINQREIRVNIEIALYRHMLEGRLRDTANHLADAQAIGNMGSWDWDMVSNRMHWSDHMFPIFGLDPNAADPSYETFVAAIAVDDRSRVESAAQKAINDRVPVNIEHHIVLPDGTERIVHQVATVAFDGTGRAVKMAGTVQDITERKRLEEQLHGALKMEALGKVTGGVAHEFNNLMQGIVGSIDIISTGLEGNDRMLRMVDIARRCAFKGKELTGRLLSYVGRWPLQPKTIDLGDFVDEAAALLTPIAGENIEIQHNVPADIWSICVDPGQLQTALINLANNSRDAMPDGGRLTISCSNAQITAKDAAARPYTVTVGDYVKITVTDTGVGMSPDILSKAFDPFFTTKHMTQGPGLGLSMVFGFIRRQSGGFVEIDSDEGKGTTVDLFIPRGEAESAPGSPQTY